MVYVAVWTLLNRGISAADNLSPEILSRTRIIKEEKRGAGSGKTEGEKCISHHVRQSVYYVKQSGLKEFSVQRNIVFEIVFMLGFGGIQILIPKIVSTFYWYTVLPYFR